MNDHVLTQAADHIWSALRAFQSEPREHTQEDLLRVVKHYLLSGVKVQLRADVVIVTHNPHPKEIIHASQSIGSNPA